MNWQPLLTATIPIQLHVASAALALALAPLQLALRKGTSTHGALGWTWTAAMCAACLSSFFILDRPMPPNIGAVSWLHLLAVFTLVALWLAIARARRGDVAGHRKSMLYLVVFGLGVPLAFAVAIPGRIMNSLLFD